MIAAAGSLSSASLKQKAGDFQGSAGKALPGRGWGWCIGLGHLLIDTDLEEKQASGVFMTEDSGAS